MYVRLKSSKQSKNQTLQIVEGVRKGKNVRQRVVASLGIVRDKHNLKKLLKLAEHLIRKIEEQGFPVPQKIDLAKLKHVETAYDGFGIVVNKLMEVTGLSAILNAAQGRERFNVEEVVKLILIQRFNFPSSKLRTYERQKDYGFDGIDLQHLYRAMDAIEPWNEQIQMQAFHMARVNADYPVDCFFFDVTTLYFESVQQDKLRDFGFSKDQKHHMVQMVLALVVDREGVPLAYDTFPGNLAETKTLIPVLEKLKNRFSVENVVVVCDRGMASRSNVEALQENNFHFVIASKLRSIAKKHKINDLSTYIPLPHQENIPEEERVLFHTLPHPQYKNVTLIVTYSPARAEKDAQDRERLLTRLQEKIGGASNEATIKKVISNSGYKKYTTTKAGSAITLNQDAIDSDVEWDGFHGIAVSNGAKLSTTEALARYKDLWRVEEGFRVAKSTLRTRPIFHWVPHRINAHVLLCFMNLFLERFLERLLRQKGTPLTPDKIRYALSQIHTMHFKEEDTERDGKMESKLTEDAEKIFRALELSTCRTAKIKSTCCA